jgi:hypothetical protein
MPPPPIPAQPKKRDRRMLIIVAAGGLALIFLLARRQSAAADTQSADGQQQLGTPVQTPTTFADNGAQAANLGNEITSALAANSDANTAALSQFGQDITGALAELGTPATSDPNAQLTSELALFKGIHDIFSPSTPQAKGTKTPPTGVTRINPQTGIQNWWWNGGWHRKPPPVGANVGGAPKPPKKPPKPKHPQAHTYGHRKQSAAAGNRTITKNPRR